MNRSIIKTRAREVITTSKPNAVTFGLIYLTLILVLNTLGTRVLSVGISETEAMNYLHYALDGNYTYALEYAESMQPPAVAYAIHALLMVVLDIVGVGFIIFLLNTIRNLRPCFANLLDGFAFPVKIILLRFLEYLFISLWSLLFIVPGVIAYYRYSQAIYLLIDDPSKSPIQCLKESKVLMSGHKNELFKLDLSLIGWYILGMIPYLGYAVQIWTTPYIGMIKALYYETLTGHNVWSYTPDYSE